MGLLTDGTGSSYVTLSNKDQGRTYSFGVWVKFTAIAGFDEILNYGDTAAHACLELQWNSGGTAIEVNNQGTRIVPALNAPQIGEWWYYSIAWDNVAAVALCGVRKQGAQVLRITKATIPTLFTGTPNIWFMGADNDAGQESAAAWAGFKWWKNRVLTPAEMIAESKSLRAVNRRNLAIEWQFKGGSLKDSSPVGNTAVSGGATLAATPDPFLRRKPRRLWEIRSTAAGGGVTGTLAINGSGATLAMVGTSTDSGSMAITGSGGTVAMQGQPIVSGTLGITGSGGTVAMSGQSANIGTLTIAPASGTVVIKESIFPLQKIAGPPPYLADKLGRPFRPQSDAWFTLHAHQSQEEIDVILPALRSLGYSGIRLMAYVHNCTTFGDDRFEPNDYYNNPPFSPTGQFDHPQAAYEANLRLTLVKLHQLDFVVFLEMLYLGFPASGQGWESEIDNAHNTTTVCLNFGAYLETTYGWLPNIVWACCGDQVPTGTRLTKVNKIIEGIESIRTSHLLVGELDEPDDHFPTDVTGLVTNMVTLDSWYGIGPSRNGQTELTADEAWSAGVANGAFEPAYLNNAWNGIDAREEVRAVNLRGVLGGGFAFQSSGDDASFEGNDARFGGVYALATVSPSPTGNKLDCSYANALFTSFAWWRMRPSGTGPLVGGTDALHAGRVLISSSNATGANHIQAAMTSDGLVLLAYIPKIGSTSTVTFTVDLQSMVSNTNALRARWWNPTSGVFSTNASAAGTYSLTNSASAQSFTTPGDNGTTQGDWILMIDGGGLFAITGSGATLAMSGTSSVLGTLAITGSGATLQMNGNQIDTGDLIITGSGGTVAMAGTSNNIGTLGIVGSGGTVAMAGTSNVVGTLAITGSGGSVDARESAYSGQDDMFLVQ